MATLTPDYSNMFINPYNFVVKTREVKRNDVKYGDLTGKITCILKVKEMLALPDHFATEEKQRFDFYRVAGKPVIPGSELKGCIRSVFETVTPSCFSVINSEILHKREDRPDQGTDESDDLRIVPGILEKDGDTWYLYEAYKIKKSEITDDLEYVERKWITFPSKKSPEHIGTKYFKKASDEHVAECNQKEIRKLRFSLERYNDNLTNKRREFGKIIEQTKRKLDNGEPVVVFYRLVNGVFQYISFAQVSRCIFNNTVPELLGDHNSLCGKSYMDGDEKKTHKYCPACRLFGTVGDVSVASRVRFSDAQAYNNVKISDNFYNLPELSSPKITSIEFYSDYPGRGNNSQRWNYDSDGVQLKGRKFYFHSKAKSEKTLGPRSVATKPALSGSEFKFDVYFDKITEEELEQLLWALTLGENNADGRLMHKLGFGKPVGYGSVKITVKDILLRSKNKDASYVVCEKSYNDYNVTDRIFEETEALQQLKKILDYYLVEGEQVSYPIAEGKFDKVSGKKTNDIFKWFGSNRPQNGTFRFVLPKITDEKKNMRLPAMASHKGNNDPLSDDKKKRETKESKKHDELVDNHIYTVKVTEIKKFGAFVTIVDSNESGLIHISEIADGYIKDINDYLKCGDEISVMRIGKNDKGYLFSKKKVK